MRPPLIFFCAGLPKAQPRAKARSMGKFARVYNPGTADDWKMIVRHEAKKAWTDYPNQWCGPLQVNLTFLFPRPKNHFRSNGILKENAPKWHTAKPDRDNLDKAVLDALTNLGIWSDDKQVCAGLIQKLYANEQPGVDVRIVELTANGEWGEQPTIKL